MPNSQLKQRQISSVFSTAKHSTEQHSIHLHTQLSGEAKKPQAAEPVTICVGAKKPPVPKLGKRSRKEESLGDPGEAPEKRRKFKGKFT